MVLFVVVVFLLLFFVVMLVMSGRIGVVGLIGGNINSG